MPLKDLKKQAQRETEVEARTILSTNNLLKMEENEEPFLLDKMIVEGSVNALTSDSGKGKSLVMLKMVEAIVKGEEFLEKYPTKQANTLILDLEMSQNDIIQRVKSIIQKDIEGLDFYTCQEFDIEQKADFEWLVDLIEKNNYKLIVFDTLSNIHTKNENDNSEMKLINKKLLELTRKIGVTVLYIHHHRKRQKGEQFSQSTSRGASEIINKCSSHLLLDSNDIIVNDAKLGAISGMKIIIEQHKARQMERLTSFSINVHYNPFIKQTVFKWAGEHDPRETATDSAKKKIIKIMKNDWEYLVADFKEQIEGIGDSALRDALRELISNDVIIFRNPGPGEKELNMKKVRSDTKIYSLKKDEEKEEKTALFT